MALFKKITEGSAKKLLKIADGSFVLLLILFGLLGAILVVPIAFAVIFALSRNWSAFFGPNFYLFLAACAILGLGIAYATRLVKMLDAKDKAVKARMAQWQADQSEKAQIEHVRGVIWRGLSDEARGSIEDILGPDSMEPDDPWEE